MIEVSRSRQIAATPASVWAILADFGSLAEWSADVDHSCLLNDRGRRIGLARRVQSGRDTFVETITAHDAPRLLAYDILGVPRGFSAANRWTIDARGEDAVTVTLTSTVSSTAPVLRPIGEWVFGRVMTQRSEKLLRSLARTLGKDIMISERPDIVVVMTDEERASPPYESTAIRSWRDRTLTGRAWFDAHGITFERHYTGSLACVPSRPTMFTGQFPDLHGVTQTDGIGKTHHDSRLRWLRPGEVPTLGNWFRAAGYDTHYDGKWHISHADLIDPETDGPLATNDDDGNVDEAAVRRYLAADPLASYGFSGWVGPEPHGRRLSDAGIRRDPLIADRVVAWLRDRYAARAAGDPDARRPFLLVASFVNPHDIVLFPAWARSSPLRSSPLDPPPVPAAPTADEDLSSKPAAQIAFREAYYSGYGPAASVERTYRRHAQRYRDLYYRLHAEVDGSIDRVRRAVTDNEHHTVLVRTADHGDLLGAHGGLHQKWFNLYDEATRVPFVIARVGA